MRITQSEDDPMPSLKARLEQLERQRAEELEAERPWVLFGPAPGSRFLRDFDHERREIYETEWTMETVPEGCLVCSGFDPAKMLGLDLINKPRPEQAVGQEPQPEREQPHQWAEFEYDV
jgi:hypothetical protein